MDGDIKILEKIPKQCLDCKRLYDHFYYVTEKSKHARNKCIESNFNKSELLDCIKIKVEKKSRLRMLKKVKLLRKRFSKKRRKVSNNVKLKNEKNWKT